MHFFHTQPFGWADDRCRRMFHMEHLNLESQALRLRE
nr:MAG TPA: hypothetical protein [Bacteriophage sp.]